MFLVGGYLSFKARASLLQSRIEEPVCVFEYKGKQDASHVGVLIKNLALLTDPRC